MKIPTDLTTPEAIALLGKLDDSDTEQAHLDADRILCNFLRSQGHGDVAAAFEKARKDHGFYYA